MIAVSDLSPAQAVKTLVHELTHTLPHGDGVACRREFQEVEVESVAVRCALALDAGDCNFAYLPVGSAATVALVKETVMQ